MRKEDFGAEGSNEKNATYLRARERSIAYRNQYGVIVICEDEAHQRAIYERLRDEGFTCKVVVV